MTKTDDFKFDKFNKSHRDINNFFEELNTQEIVVNFMIPLYHFALLDELKTEKYKDDQRAQKLKEQLEKENINIDEIKRKIPELKINGSNVDTFDLLKKFVLFKVGYKANFGNPTADSIIEYSYQYGIEELDRDIKLAGWMAFFGGSFIDQRIRFVYDYLASQSEKTINKSNDKELEKVDEAMENEDTKTNWQSCLKRFLECKDFVSSWKNSKFRKSEFFGLENMISNQKLHPLQVKLINALKHVDKIEYQSLYEIVDKMNLNSDDKKFIYCNVIPNISEMMIPLSENINSPQGDFHINSMDNDTTVQKKIYGLTLYKDKKIGFNDLIIDFFDNNPGSSSAKEKIDFSNVCNDVITVLRDGGIINKDTASDLTQQIKNATDISTLGIIWQAIVNFFKSSVVKEKINSMTNSEPNKPLKKISTWEKAKRDRAINNIKKPLSQLSKLLNTRQQSDRNKNYRNKN